MEPQDGHCYISISNANRAEQADLNWPAHQKYSLAELHSIISDPRTAIPIMQNTGGQTSSQASQV